MAILNFDDKNFNKYKKHVHSNLWLISIKKQVKGCFIKRNNIIFNNGHINEIVAKTSDVKLIGEHNKCNVLMSVLVAKILGISNSQIVDVLRKFNGLPHRLNMVSEINGVKFINDSKSTNQDSTTIAINSIKEKTTLLVGGYDKGIPITEMFRRIKHKIKNLIAYGDCGLNFVNQATSAGIKQIYYAPKLKEAFDIATKITKQGDVVLLSPATSSFDEFSNFEERGEYFEQLVKGLEKNTNIINTKT